MKEYKLKDIFQNNLDKGKLVLPDFQREYVWKDDQQKNLLASILVKLPIGNLLLIKGSNEDFAVKRIAFKGSADNSTIDSECEYLLDGQQRVTTLLNFFYDFYKSSTEWKENNSKLYYHLRKRWYLCLDNIEAQVALGYDKLKFEDLSSKEPGDVLSALTCFKINNSSFSKESDYFHPEYSIKDNLGNEIQGGKYKNKLARKLAEECKIPLYCIYDDREDQNNSLLTKVIKYIAQHRVNDLKEECKNNPERVIELLSHIEEDVEQYIDDREEIEQIWVRLQTQWAEDIRRYLFGLLEFDMATIVLPAEEISRAIAIFESVNEGGTKLSNFDLIVAKAARDKSYDKSLIDRISEILKNDIFVPDSFKLNSEEKFDAEAFKIIDDKCLSNVFKDSFLNLLSIYNYTNCEGQELKIDLIKQKRILGLSAEAINSNIQIVVKSLIRAYVFLHYRCGVICIEDIPYKLMTLPIASLLMEDSNWNDRFVIDRLEYYYLVSIFGGAYRERQNQRCIDDLDEINSLVKNVDKFSEYKKRVLKVQSYCDKNTLLMKEKDGVPIAIQKSIYHYLLSQQPKDFLSNNKLKTWEVAKRKTLMFDKKKEELNVELHHIIPLGEANMIKQSANKLRKDKMHILNSPMNKTYISKYSNRLISDTSPAKYFQLIDDYQFVSHAIPSEMNTMVKEKNGDELYRGFVERRYSCFNDSLKARIESLV